MRASNVSRGAPLLVGLAAGILTLTILPKSAQAQAACANLPDEPGGGPITKIYIENGDTQEPLIKKVGKLLVNTAGAKLRIIYRNRPTCELRDSLFLGRQMQTVTTPARPVRYIPTNPAFDPTTAAPECTVPDAPAPGEPIVLGIGATYLSSCPAATQPTDIGVFDGPIQAYAFITHKDSAQVAITAEEGYLAYGFTEGGGEASPWVVQNLRFKRNNTASTTLTMSSAIRLLPTQMKAADFTTSDALVTAVTTQGAANPNATLGVLGTELYDARRQGANDLKLLAFKTFGQKYAYFPDKTNTTFDKQNVRDGHYLPWSPTPYIAKKDGTGAILDPNVKRLYELIAGLKTEADVDGLKQVVGSGLIPKCAMKVTRSGDGADLSLYSDPAPCGCYFEKNVPQGATTCTACTDDTPCGGGKCRFGFCETK